ncbi:MAG: polysaccharide lyase family 8 super-sandwich domain-containing protein [Paludibacteraceae bacterium]|nr:polysaccharide lyase family 8 super-sandwich domain-containing protein [Paludibacteraceae bacterium]
MRKFVFVLCACAVQMVFAADEFTLLRYNLRYCITLGPTDYDPEEPHMRAYLDDLALQTRDYQYRMRHDTTFLWDEWKLLTGVPEYTPFHVHYSYQRLLVMSRAWAYPGSAFYQDTTLLADIRFGLQLLYRIAYNEHTPMCGNWWEWRIGNAHAYAHIVSILYEELTPEELQQFRQGASRHVRDFAIHGNLTFANQADICSNLLMIGILTDNASDIQQALQCAIPAFVDNTTIEQRLTANREHDSIIRQQAKYQHDTPVWKKEGLYADGTFIQHIAIPYIGTYGCQIIELASLMQRVLQGSSFSIPRPIADILPTWIEKTYLPSLYRGEVMLMFMGRGNARNPYINARNEALNIIEVAPLISDTTRRNRILHTCADMIANDRHYSSPLNEMDPLPVHLPRIRHALSLKTDSEYVDTFSIVLAAGDRVIHQTEQFRLGIAMSSNRIGKYEAFVRTDKNENNCAWYTGDGMTYIYTPNDPHQYRQYIPRMNPYRVPGTTVDLIPRQPCASDMILFDSQPKTADIARAGGVMTANRYSSAMMQLIGSRSDLMAKKSWFCFDNEVVCLGADISLDERREVITTVENRQFTRQMYINGSDIGQPREQAYRRVTIAYLDSTGGYFFPHPVRLHANVSDSGFCELWLSHGYAPKAATYAYVLLPQMTQTQVLHYARNPHIRILANNERVQAVEETELGITCIHFWQPSACGRVRCDATAAVILREDNDFIYLSIADPTWQQSSITLTIGDTTLCVDTKNTLGMTQYRTIPKHKPL